MPQTIIRQRTEVIKARDVPSIAAVDCVLFLWTTNQHLRIAIDVMEAWGFEYKSNYCWGKDRIGLGFWNRSRHELLLVGTHGKIPLSSAWHAMAFADHGAARSAFGKAECFLEMIEQYYPNAAEDRAQSARTTAAWLGCLGNEVEAEAA